MLETPRAVNGLNLGSVISFLYNENELNREHITSVDPNGRRLPFVSLKLTTDLSFTLLVHMLQSDSTYSKVPASCI